jgi:hypothetical protein
MILLLYLIKNGIFKFGGTDYSQSLLSCKSHPFYYQINWNSVNTFIIYTCIIYYKETNTVPFSTFH